METLWNGIQTHRQAPLLFLSCWLVSTDVMGKVSQNPRCSVAGWIGAGCSGWFPGQLKLEAVTNFRSLTEAIVEQRRRSGFGTNSTAL